MLCEIDGQKVDDAIHQINRYLAGRNHVGGFSGGKDSVVIKRLAEMSGIDVSWTYNVTGIDPPELIRFIKQRHADVSWRFPKKPFFARVPEKGMPTRGFRWCCEEYKEARLPRGTVFVAGIRAEESPRRARDWGAFTTHKRSNTSVLSPILDWNEGDVWAFIEQENLPYCSLYDEDFSRLGCVGCPLSSVKAKCREFGRWPKYKRLWWVACQELWDRRKGTRQRDGREWFASALFYGPDDFFDWWLNNKRTLPKGKGALD